MTPRLVALTGPFKGSIIPLAGVKTSIGRLQTNVICIEDPSMSRRHCVVKRDEQQFKIEDLGTLNSTFVNGLPIKERALAHADEIRVGDSAFLFLLDDDWSPEPLGSEQADSTIPLPRLRSQGVTLRVSASKYKEGRIRGGGISSGPGIDALQQQLLHSIFDVIPADRAALVFAGEWPLQFAGHRKSGEPCVIDVSLPVLDRVLRERVAVFSNGKNERASLAVPLVVADQVIGSIYVDKPRSNATAFTEHDAKLLSAIARPAAFALKQWREREHLESENQRLRAEANLEHNMVGQTARMKQVYEFIAKVAPSASTVLIRGESGTGKELAARAIHRNSPRSGKPFVAINCAALTETLLESELFGHERGAFTGAIALKKGKFEEANGGSLFLDEVGELAPNLQTKLLRVLQEREFERVGGTRTLKIDIRLIAATNRDLEKAVRDGPFRRDLYFRLNVVSLTMPPLRDRLEDILSLARHFARKHAKNSNRLVTGLSEEAQACLLNYDWPGNVRELENAIERAVVLGCTEVIQAEDLPESVVEAERGESTSCNRFHEAIKEAKKKLVMDAFEQTGGNHADAAKRLGLHPNNLHRLMRSLNLRPSVSK